MIIRQTKISGKKSIIYILSENYSGMDAIPIKLSLIGDTVFCFNADGEYIRLI